jgi:hypothetical protein
MTSNLDIATALGRELWTTDSFIPQYRSVKIGPWRINAGGQLVNDRGYFSGPCILEMLPSLARKTPSNNITEEDGWETWMSLTPHEIESQELGFQYAFGKMAIMGLGMGWIAANAALNPQVTNVTVVERDPDVINLFHESGAFESIPSSAQQKISIIEADAIEWHPDPGQIIDFLYADIWLHLAERGTLGQVARMQDNVQAKQVYFWGQELTIYSAIALISKDKETITDDLIQRALKDVINLPLLIPGDRNYGKMIEQVIKNRIERRLPYKIDIDYQAHAIGQDERYA